MADWVSYREFHRPTFYRYKVADSGFRAVRNRYTEGGSITIGWAVVVGHYAYCVKWAWARLRRTP